MARSPGSRAAFATASISGAAPTWTCASPNPPTSTDCAPALGDPGLSNSEIQSISPTLTDPNANEVVISLEQKGQGDQALDVSKTRYQCAEAIYGGQGSATSRISTPRLLLHSTDILSRNGSALAGVQRRRPLQPARARRFSITAIATKNGVLTNFDDLRQSTAQLLR